MQLGRWYTPLMGDYQVSRYLEPEYPRIVDTIIQRNAYFGHSENNILAMLTDDRQAILS